MMSVATLQERWMRIGWELDQLNVLLCVLGYVYLYVCMPPSYWSYLLSSSACACFPLLCLKPTHYGEKSKLSLQLLFAGLLEAGGEHNCMGLTNQACRWVRNDWISHGDGCMSHFLGEFRIKIMDLRGALTYNSGSCWRAHKPHLKKALEEKVCFNDKLCSVLVPVTMLWVRIRNPTDEEAPSTILTASGLKSQGRSNSSWNKQAKVRQRKQST